MAKVDLKNVKRAQEICEKELGRDLTRDESFILGLIYEIAHLDGANHTLDEFKKMTNQK